MTPETILFKVFKGNVENSRNTAFSLLPDTNLLSHLANLSAYGRRIDDSDDEWEPPTCSRCPERSVQTCQMCCEPFCKSCYDFKHLKPPWDNHSYVSDLLTHLLTSGITPRVGQSLTTNPITLTSARFAPTISAFAS